MQNLPLVTVICLCYNHQDYVVETLNSVLAQSYQNIEIVIVDDFSTDNSVKVIEDWLIKNPNITFIKNPRNLGNTKSFNLAVQAAQGEFLIDLACDDLLFEHTVAAQVNSMLQAPTASTALVYGNAINIDEVGRVLSYYFPVNEKEQVLQQRKSGDIYTDVVAGGASMCSVSALYNRKIFDSLNGYDEALAYEDLDYWIRASRRYEIYFSDQVWVKKRQLEHSLGSHFVKNNAFAKRVNQSTYLILSKTLELNQIKAEDRALLCRIHYEITCSLKRHDYRLFLKHLLLKTRVHLQNRPH
ncbi:glycosyltransferase family 2 protein [Flavobacterium sp. JP2137]|uniref:glycosyltransferase family 2 protein n=1 Tax=Flavobacterium sp. JP2137 TaxID=3414510 RepID=UPI003D2FE3C2